MKKYIVVLGLVCGVNLTAAPSPYAKGLKGFNIESPKAEVVPDHEFNTNKQVWVKPPKTGVVNVKNFSADANDSFLQVRCEQAKSILSASNSVSKQILKTTQDADQYKGLLDAAIVDENAARKIFGDVSAKPGMQELIDAKNEVADTNDLLSDVAVELDKCKQECDKLSFRYTDLLDALRENRRFYNELRNENRLKARELERASRKLEQATMIVETYAAPYQKKLSNLISMRAEFMEMFSVDAVTEGGWAAVDYETKWEEIIEELQIKYPQFNFRPIPTYNVDINLHLDFMKNESYLSSLPSVIDYRVSGLPQIQKGNFEIEDDGLGKKIKYTKSSMPAIVNGDFRMSLLTTCGKLDKFFYDGLDDEPEVNDLNFHKFGFSVNYQFESKFDFDFKMTYNTSEIYKLIKKRKKKRRFFSTKSMASVVEDSKKNSTIKFTWDPGSSYNKDDRALVEAKMRKEVVARMLDLVAVRVPPAEQMEAGPAPQSGAMVLANGINDVCGNINIYCKAGGWMFKALDSIFGSSSSESAYLKKTNFTSEEQMNGSEYFWVSDSVSFTR